MLDKIKYNIGRYLLKLRLKKKLNDQTTYNGLVTKSRRVFIIMPENRSGIDDALDVVRYFTLHGKKVIVFIKKQLSEAIPGNVTKIEYDDEDITRLNLPSKSLNKKLNNIECDLAIDLNRPGKLFFAAASNSVKSKIRFASDNGELLEFYNFHYHSSAKEPAVFYRSLISFFSMF
ncbi:hypothetical protein ACSSWA_14145 [Melioribacter sp. Ez-97]|uniref:hypothetical protein n=1 Tax=Melioribacter sp. Ez-97 TaxID=3423434 RepID=UPI003EDA4820